MGMGGLGTVGSVVSVCGNVACEEWACLGAVDGSWECWGVSICLEGTGLFMLDMFRAGQMLGMLCMG